MKKIFGLFFSVFVLFLVVSCDGTSDSAKKCNVEFYGTNISTVQVDEGKELSSPAEPEKDGYCFAGWYKDEKLTQEVSFPLVINSDTVLYPKFEDAKKTFLEAREKTVGDSVSSFEYEYNITANVKYSALTLEGTTVGNTKYNKDLETSFLDVHQNSGALFFDGSQTSFQSNGIYTKVEIDNDGTINDYKFENINYQTKTEFNIFNKAIFEFKDNEITNLKRTANKGEYEILTTLNFTTIVSTLGEYLANPFVKIALRNVPLNEIDAKSIVSFDNGFIDTYKYLFAVNVKGINFTLAYEMDMKTIDNNTSISTPTYDDVHINSEEISLIKTELDTYLNQYKNLQHSGYDFELKSGVDFDGSNSIDATVKGSTRRKVGSQSYFINDIEIDSDLKNGDLYKSAGLKDIHVHKTILSNNDAYIIEKKALTDDVIKLDNYSLSDNDLYYLLGLFASADQYKLVQKTVSGSTTTYSIALNTNSLKNVLNYINEYVNIDPTNKASQIIKLFGDYEGDSLEISKCKFSVKVVNGQIQSVELNSKGTFNTKFTNSRDFNDSKFAEYNLKFSIKTNSKGDSWEPYSTVNDAKKGK